MSVASLGKFTIEVTPTSDDPQIMQVDVGSENRKDVISMRTNVGENVDQFGMRVRSMLRSLLNGEPKVLIAEQVDAVKRGPGRPKSVNA